MSAPGCRRRVAFHRGRAGGQLLARPIWRVQSAGRGTVPTGEGRLRRRDSKWPVRADPRVPGSNAHRLSQPVQCQATARAPILTPQPGTASGPDGEHRYSWGRGVGYSRRARSWRGLGSRRVRVADVVDGHRVPQHVVVRSDEQVPAGTGAGGGSPHRIKPADRPGRRGLGTALRPPGPAGQEPHPVQGRDLLGPPGPGRTRVSGRGSIVAETADRLQTFLDHDGLLRPKSWPVLETRARRTEIPDRVKLDGARACSWGSGGRPADPDRLVLDRPGVRLGQTRGQCQHGAVISGPVRARCHPHEFGEP